MCIDSDFGARRIQLFWEITGHEVYCASMFLSQNLHFVRMRRVVETVVEDMLVVSYAKPPEGARDYANAFRDFVVRTGGS
jgi:hypothetical protein